MSSTKTKLLDSAQKNLLKGQYAKAVSDYRQIIQLEPSDMRHRQKLAEILTKANLKDEAISEYTSLAKHYIDSVHYLKAIAVYKQVQKLDPTNPEISLTLASLNEKQGLIGNATAEYASALHIHEKNGENLKALKVLESMLALDPGNSAVRLRIAEKYFTVGKEGRSFDEFLALATDLKSRDDENGYMHVAEKIRQLFKERAQELFSMIEGEKEDEAPVHQMPEERLSEQIQVRPEPPGPLAAEKKEPVAVVATPPESPSPVLSAKAEEGIDEIPIIEELEEIEEVEEFTGTADEPEWEEDIELDLDVAHAGPSADDEILQDIEEFEESGPVIELDELELEDIELELELDEEELVGEASLSGPDELSGQELTESPFDLANELSMFADEIDFDLIRTSASDSQFTLDTASGFKRNELDHEDTESHFSLGLAYKEMGLFDEAISEFIVASKSQERKIDSLILQAVCFREQGETEKAVEILSDTLNLPEINDDGILGVKYELAICREALGEDHLARQLYTEIMTVRPDFSDTASRIDSLQHS